MADHLAKVRVTSAVLSGMMLLDGQRIPFKATVDYPKVNADIDSRCDAGKPVDQWKAFRALERFIDDQLRG